MAKTTTADRVIDGVQENTSLLIDLARTGNDRMYRFNRLLIEEAEQTQDEQSALVKQLVTKPTEVSTFANSLFSTLQVRSRRRLKLARTVVNDLRDVAMDTRTMLGRAADANRGAFQATAQASRQAAGRVVRSAAHRVEEVTDRVEMAGDRVVQMADRATTNGAEPVTRTAAPKRKPTRRKTTRRAPKPKTTDSAS